MIILPRDFIHIPIEEAPTINSLFMPPRSLGDGDPLEVGGVIQGQRREFKYIVTAREAHNIRNFLTSYLYPDEHTGDTKYGYLVHSVYLDDFQLTTCAATQQGLKNRFKLRVRFYDDNPDSPAFLEVKRRENQIISKTRATVSKEVANAFLKDPTMFLDFDMLLKPDDKEEKRGLYNFRELCYKLRAKPTRYTSYYREAYEQPGDNSVRVSMDRDVRGADFDMQLDASMRSGWGIVSFGGVILELKFNGSPPRWMGILAQEYNLQRGSAAKYVESIALRDYPLADFDHYALSGSMEQELSYRSPPPGFATPEQLYNRISHPPGYFTPEQLYARRATPSTGYVESDAEPPAPSGHRQVGPRDDETSDDDTIDTEEWMDGQ